MFKSDKGISRIALILIVIVGAVIIGGIFLIKDKKDISIRDNFINTKSSKYKILLQGKEYNLPFNLENLTKQGFFYVGDNWESRNFDEFTTRFEINSNESYYGIPSAGIKGSSANFELDLVQKQNAKREYKNITVAGFSITNVSSDFISINRIGCNSTVEDVVHSFKLDLNDSNIEKSADITNGYLNFQDEDENISFQFLFKNGKVLYYKIFLNNKSSLK